MANVGPAIGLHAIELSLTDHADELEGERRDGQRYDGQTARLALCGPATKAKLDNP